MATDPSTQAFLTTDAQSNTSEIDDGMLAQEQSGNAAVAQIGRWFQTQHSFLQGGLEVVATDVGGTAAPSLDATQQATLAALTPLSGAAFDEQYLSSEITGHEQSLAAHQTYIATDANATVVQAAQAEAPIIQDHIYELQLIDAAYYGGAAPTVDFTSRFTAAPPLATPTANNTQDQIFINDAFNDATTGVDEGNLALSKAYLPSTEVYGAWEVVNDGPLNADIASLASSTHATVPAAIDAASAAQVLALSSLTGQAFDTQLAADSIADYQSAITMFSAEVAGGSDAALLALAGAALPTAEQLLGQAVFDDGESAGGLGDITAGPSTVAGSILTAAANAAATGTALIAGADGSTTTPGALTSGQVGIQFVNASGAAAAGYGFVLDTAAAAVTITGAANQFEAVNGSAAGMTFDGGAGGSGELALNGGDNEVLGASTAGAYYVDAAAGDNTIQAGNGNDTVSTTGGTNQITLGNGSNAVISGADDTITGTDGSDTVFATAGTSSVTTGMMGITFVAAGAVSASVYTTYVTPVSASGSSIAGNAMVTVFGAAGAAVSVLGQQAIIVAGAGNETLSTGVSILEAEGDHVHINPGGNEGNTFFAGSGNDLLNGDSDQDLFFAGTGNASITGGGGADIVAFVNGAAGGSDAIAFGADSLGVQPKLSLLNYGAGAVSQAIASATTSAGGVSFTLSDNTHVTLTGITSLTSADFV